MILQVLPNCILLVVWKRKVVAEASTAKYNLLARALGVPNGLTRIHLCSAYGGNIWAYSREGWVENCSVLCLRAYSCQENR